MSSPFAHDENPLIDEEPRYGAGGKKIVFVYPQAQKGILLELCETGPSPI